MTLDPKTMFRSSDLILIHIIWDGPFSMEAAQQAETADDFGLYQIYGKHEITGPETLLYIGKAAQGKLGWRIKQHDGDWGRWEPSSMAVYLGRLAGLESTTDERWGELIGLAEDVLIFKVGVPYNSSGIRWKRRFAEPPAILVVNHG